MKAKKLKAKYSKRTDPHNQVGDDEQRLKEKGFRILEEGCEYIGDEYSIGLLYAWESIIHSNLNHIINIF